MGLSKEEKLKRKEERRENKWRSTHKYIKGVDHKLCNFCNEYKPSTVDYYYKSNSNSIDGLQPSCKECAVVKFRLWAEKYPEKYEKQKKDRVARNDPMRLIRSREAAERNRIEGYQKKWRQENRDKLKQYNYKHMHKQHDISNDEWISCLEYFDYKCSYCGISQGEAKEKQGHNLHMEHAINSGASDLSNCIPACRNCNSQKWKRDYSEWYIEGNTHFDENKLNKIEQWLNGDYKIFKEENAI